MRGCGVWVSVVWQRVSGFLVASGVCLAATPAAAQSAIYYPGRWQLTQYWIAQERPSPRDARAATPVRSRDGHAIAYTCSTFLADLTMEGTGRTWDGRILNWDTRIGHQACFVEVDRDSYPFGIGVAGYALVPFRSLAVDSRYIPIGHTVEMPDLIGLSMPDGSRHDGCFVAVDGGGAINGHHIDLFVPNPADWYELSRARELPSHVRQVVVDAPRCSFARRYALLPMPGDPPLAR